MIGQASNTSALRRVGFAGLVASAMVLLAACGAQVSSELEIAEDHSGTRTIVATIAEEDIEELSGGIEATEAALEAHLPEQLSFEGISEAGSTEETEDEASGDTDGYQAVFTLEFSDIGDYETQAQELIDLAAAKAEEARDSSEPEVDHRTIQLDLVESDGPLLDGFVLEEDFTGADLLDWTSFALVDESVIDEDQADSIISSSGDEGRVQFNGEEYEDTEPFSLKEGTDQRFSSVAVRITDEGTQVDFAAPFNDGDYDTGFELGQQYLEEADVGEIQQDTEGYWTVTLDESGSLQDQLRTLLDTEDLEIEVEDTANTDEATLVTTLTGTGFSCPTVCGDYPSISVDGYGGDVTPLQEEVDGDTFSISYERSVPIDQVEVATEVTLSGSVAQTYRFSVANEHAEAFGEDLQTVFTPPEGTGSVETETQDDAVVYVAELDAADPQELNQTLETFLPGSSIYVSGLEGFSIWPSYTVDVSSYGVEALGAQPTQSVELPVLHSADLAASNGIDDQLTSDESDYRVSAAGPTLAGMLVVGGLLVLVIILVVLVVVFRKRIARGMRTAQEHARTTAAAANASWQERSAEYEAVPDQPTGPVDDASWQANFDEAKLH